MRLPFTPEQFFDVFRRYNEGVWPAQWVFNLLALVVLILAVVKPWRDGRVIPAILAVLWLWMGAVYHVMFFADVNPAAYGFGVLFIAQGLMFAWLGLRHTKLLFAPSGDVAGVAGWVLVIYALILYPAIGLGLGHAYPASPTFGLPCPTTLFTLGVLLWSRPAMPWGVLVVPVLWTVIGTLAAAQLGVWEDLGLGAAGVFVAGWVIARHRRAGSPIAHPAAG